MVENSFVPSAYLSFDGKDDYLALPAMNIDWSQGMTLEAWVRYEKFNQYARIVDFHNNGTGSIHFFQGASDPHLYCRVMASRGSPQLEGKSVLELGAWLHVAVTTDASGVGRIYKNGKLVATGPLVLPDSIERINNWIGRSPLATDGYFHGQMAEFRVWKVARSEADLQRDMNRRLSGSEPGLVAYLPMDEGSGDVARDRSPNGIHATRYGATWVAPQPTSEKRGSRPVLSFRNDGDLVDLGKKPEYKVQRDFTLEAWIYTTGRRKWGGIISKIWDTNDVESGYGLTLDDGSGFYLALKPPKPGNSIEYLSSGRNTLPLNEWHHIAGTFDGKQAILYIDGEKIASHACEAASIRHDPDSNLYIGIYKDDDEAFSFPGKIAEARVWNVARTPEEIRANWRRRLHGDEKNLVAYWAIDEGVGRTINDKSALASHGTITGAVWEVAELSFELRETTKSPPSDERFDEQAKRIAALEAAANKCSDCAQKLAEQAKTIGELTKAGVAVERKAAEQDQKFAELDKKLNATERDNVEQERKLLEQDRKLAEQEKSNAEQERKLLEQDRKLLQQDRKLAEQEKSNAEQERKLLEQDKKLAEQEKSNAEQERKLAELAAKAALCSACEEKLTAQAKTIADLDKKLAELAAKAALCAACEEKLGEQNRIIDALSRRVDELAKKPEEKTPPPPPAKPEPPDDFEKIEGIGPKIAEELKTAGIRTYKQLAATDVAELQKILKAGGTKYARNDPASWPKQAQLLIAGKTAELKALQASLNAGRSKG